MSLIRRDKIREEIMDEIQINESGQLIISTNTAEALGFENGMELKVVKNDDCYFIIPKKNDLLGEIQKLFEGEAERMGFETEEDAMQYAINFRKQRKLQNANND